MTGAPATLAEIHDEFYGRSYPCEVLSGCETALILFAAGFYGRQDAYWIAEAGLIGTCVDHDVEKLLDMTRIYPPSWKFLVDDVYKFAERTGDRWDVVSIDCPSNDFERCAELTSLWCDLARHAVILGASRESGKIARARSGSWGLAEMRWRSTFAGGTYWALLEAP